MEPEVIEEVLRSLQPDRWGWCLDAIPGARFLDHPVGLRVDTSPVATRGPSPPLDAVEKHLVRLILGQITAILNEVDDQYRKHVDVPDEVERAFRSHVWLSRDLLAENGPLCWAFVIGVADAPNWGIHAEFEGRCSAGSGRAINRPMGRRTW